MRNVDDGEPRLLDGEWWARDELGNWVQWNEADSSWGLPKGRTTRRSRRLPAWLIGQVIVLVLLAAFAIADRAVLHWYTAPARSSGADAVDVVAPVPTASPTPEQDRVVGVLNRCDASDFVGASIIEREGCASAAKSALVYNHRIEVTVRTPGGSTYTVTLAPTARVRVGDTWPP